MNTLSTTKRYGLRLGNGQGWQIIGVNGMATAAEKLASIMQLQACQGDEARKLILKRWKRDGPAVANPVLDLPGNIAVDLPKQGWKANKGALHHEYIHDETPDAIFAIKEPVIYPRYDRLTIGERGEKALKQALRQARVFRRALRIIYQLAQDDGGLPVHGALVSWNGLGVLLLGYSGAGKSTCCRRLPTNWQALSDDETLVVRNNRGEYLGHPFPTWSNFGIPKPRLQQWHRTSWRVEQCVPLAAIFILEQAETDEIIPLGGGAVALRLNGSAAHMWLAFHAADRDMSVGENWLPRRQLFDNGCAIARSTPAFILRASLTGRFWEEMERTLSQLPMAGSGEIVRAH